MGEDKINTGSLIAMADVGSPFLNSPPRHDPRTGVKKYSRNKPCPCGSDKKYKKCCI